MTRDQLERRIDALYAAEPSTFVARRNALVHELAAEKQVEAKKRIHELRRPTVAAWIVNCLYREKRAELDELMAAGADLRSAQRALLDGRGSQAFAAATERERKATTRLLEDARRLLEANGHGLGVELRPVTATLRALARDAQASAAFNGRLSEALEPPGFEGLLQAAADVPSVSDIAKPVARDGHQERLRQEMERREQQRLAREAEKRQALEDEQADARSVLDERRRQADRLQREADGAGQKATAAAERVHDLERMLREARGDEQHALAAAKQAKLVAEAAVAEVRLAQEKLDQLDRQLGQLATHEPAPGVRRP